MKAKIILIAFILMSMIKPIYAAEISKDNLSVTYVSVFGDRVSNPTYAYVTVIGLDDLSWLPTECASADGVIIPNSNNGSIIDTALLAVETGKKVRVRIETSVLIGNYCELVQLMIWTNGSLNN